jgi:hypothetical protein
MKIRAGFEKVKNQRNYESERYSLYIEEDHDITVISPEDEVRKKLIIQSGQDYCKNMVLDAIERKITEAEFKLGNGTIETVAPKEASKTIEPVKIPEYVDCECGKKLRGNTSKFDKNETVFYCGACRKTVDAYYSDTGQKKVKK